MKTSISPWMLLLVVFLGFAIQILLVRASRRIRSRIAKDQPLAGLIQALVAWGLGLASVLLWAFTILGLLELVPETQPWSHWLLSLGIGLFGSLESVIFSPFIKRGETAISIYTVLQVIVFVSITVLFARTARRVLLRQILSKTPLDLGVQHAVATFTQYLVLALGFLIGVNT